MATVTDIKNESSSIIAFRLNGLTNNQSSQVFNLDKLGSQCSIKMVYNDYESDYNFYLLTFTVDFVDEPYYLHNKVLELTASFNSSACQHMFTLKKMSEKVFISDDRTVREDVFESHLSFDVKIKIYVSHDSNIDDLVTDMKKLCVGKAHSDWQIAVEDDKYFNVHKNILSARSEVLSKMIQSDMIEKKTNTIKLLQWDYAVVEQLLSYIYTNSCNVTVNTHKLFQLSHYLEIQPLQSLCQRYLTNNISISNIVGTLEMTRHNQYELSDLKVVAEKFVEKNEKLLAKDDAYIEYLSKSINIDNLASTLLLAHKYSIEILLDEAIKYMICNHQEALEIEKCNKLLCSEPPLMLKLLKHSLKANQCSHCVHQLKSDE